MTATETMRAAVIDRFGPPEVLHMTEVPKPRPGDGEVLVAVRAAGVNAIDWLIRAGISPAEFPLVIGWDVSGTVVATGPHVTGLREGDDVFGMLRFPSPAGCYAEYVAAPAAELAIKPDNIDHLTAAAAPMAGITAWQALFRQGEIAQGQRVLVHSAAGGVGHVAVQLAKLAGAAEVIGTASARNHDFLTGLGADRVIDYTSERISEVVSDLDLVVDPRGGADFFELLEVVRPGGVIVTLKGKQQGYENALAERGVRDGYVYVTPDREALTEVTRYLAEGRLNIAIDRVLPLDDVVKAHTFGEQGHVRGRIVLEVS
ncbi:NADP-dependent oxidoreductase [Actinophytocola sp.]|uniref:NADP-dependent oxidoreductase n=1 Tax=Actinophytocola sp. TaxID=1872138 RepID=UPI002ED3966D